LFLKFNQWPGADCSQEAEIRRTAVQSQPLSHKTHHKKGLEERLKHREAF
jgi:hypothetical protein